MAVKPPPQPGTQQDPPAPPYRTEAPLPPTTNAASAGMTLSGPLPSDIPPADPSQPESPPVHAQAPEAVKQVLWSVADANATKKDDKGRSIPRYHSFLDLDAPIALYGPDRPTPMPVHLASRFLIDPAFIVKNEHNQRVTPVTKAVTRPSDGAVLLQPGQIVVAFDELSTDALRKRVALLPGADPSFVTYADRPQLLMAITQHDLESRRQPVGDADAESLATAPGGAGLRPASRAWLDRVMPAA